MRRIAKKQAKPSPKIIASAAEASHAIVAPPDAKSRAALTRRAAVKPANSKKPPLASSKIDRVIAALRAPKGASISDLMELTGWQMHSVRGAIAGAVKKKRGLSVISEKIGAERIYRIARTA